MPGMDDENGGKQGEPESLGDVTSVDFDSSDNDPDASDYDFESMFPRKSVPTPPDELRKGPKRAKVRVYEIEL